MSRNFVFRQSPSSQLVSTTLLALAINAFFGLALVSVPTQGQRYMQSHTVAVAAVDPGPGTNCHAVART